MRVAAVCVAQEGGLVLLAEVTEAGLLPCAFPCLACDGPRIAYSSISHMGFVTIGIGSSTNMGINGAILQMGRVGSLGRLRLTIQPSLFVCAKTQITRRAKRVTD